MALIRFRKSEVISSVRNEASRIKKLLKPELERTSDRTSDGKWFERTSSLRHHQCLQLDARPSTGPTGDPLQNRAKQYPAPCHSIHPTFESSSRLLFKCLPPIKKKERFHRFPFPPCFHLKKKSGFSCHMCLPRRELELGCWALG